MFDFYAKWMALPEWQKVPFIGLTATPWTKGLGKLYDDLLIPTTTAELIEKQFLSPFKVFAPAIPICEASRRLPATTTRANFLRSCLRPS
jgi:DNA repair protein RadD